MKLTKFVLPLCLLAASSAISSTAFAVGNASNDSFSKSKKMLERQVYQDHRVTIYCGAKFDAKKSILAPDGFITTKYAKRARRIEWEHVVPAENFGRAFSEWRTGDK